jgi:ubiquinone/menaquinone biosynthesis C-methylase UbiE
MSKPTSDVAAETERVRAIQDRTAPRYDRQISFFERVLFADGREWATSHARGDVLELAVGTGRNLEHYSPGTKLTGIELSDEMLAIARRRAVTAGIEADLRQGDAQSLEFGDESFDTVVITLALCTIPDDRKAAAEAYRVLRPGGRLVLLEHVRSPLAPVRLVQRALQPLALRFEGDNLVRDPLDFLTEIGFEIETVERLKWGIVQRVVARRPEGPRPAGGAAAG